MVSNLTQRFDTTRSRDRRTRIFGTGYCLALIVLCTLLSSSARAVVVGTTLGTNVNPAAYVPESGLPSWTQGDPGWENVTQSGSNFVYLGDGWVLTARHISAGTATFASSSFSPIGSQNYIISNPPSALAHGASLTPQTDLRLFRIDGDPGLPSLTIASQSPQFSGTAGSEVVFIGQGRLRDENETHWQIANVHSTSNNWSASEVQTGGNVHGYKTNMNRSKRWGTNRLENPSSFPSSTFPTKFSPTTAVMPLTTADNQTRDVISMVTTFNQQTAAGALPFESQAVSGDSGGAVFHNRGTALNPDWVLAGIVNATIIYGNQSRNYSVYGNSTTFADLSYYNKPYKNSICDIMKSCGAYSVMGDINMDGVVIGDGSGSTEDDDVAALVAGWGSDNFAGKGDYDSWRLGDLNLDGTTNVADFLLLRSALNGPIGSGAMEALFGPVPEPTSLALAAIAMIALASGRRRRAAL